MQDCVSHEISRYYDAWKKKAVGITRDKNKADDLLHTVIARLLDRADDEITQRACNGKLNAYVCRAMWLSYHSNTSDYHVLFRKYQQRIDAGDVDDQKSDDVFDGPRIDGEYLYSYILRMNEHDAILLRLYSQPDFSYHELSKHTGIPVMYLYKAVNNALNRIRKNAKFQRPTEDSQ